MKILAPIFGAFALIGLAGGAHAADATDVEVIASLHLQAPQGGPGLRSRTAAPSNSNAAAFSAAVSQQTFYPQRSGSGSQGK